MSTLDGINKVKEYPKYCKEKLGQIAVSQTDHGVMTGSWQFFKSCKEAGIKPLLGCEFYYASSGRHTREKDDLDKAYYHLILLAKNNNGLHNLFKLNSLAFTEG